MRVLVIGATGVLGRPLIPALCAAGHSVVGMARSPEKLVLVDTLGGQAVRGDILDVVSVRKAVQDARPEAIINLATSIPLRLRITAKDWETNDRIRTEGSTNLLNAALDVSPRILIQESVGYVCAPQGDTWIDENSPVSQHPFLRGTVQMEQRVRAAQLPTVLLRFAALQSPESWHTQQTVAALKKGMLPIIGDGTIFLSQIHVSDAVQAILLCLEKAEVAAGQTFHVADNQPARMREVFPYAAQLLKVAAPRRVAPMMARMVVGALTMEVLTMSYRIANARIREALGFAPRYPTYQESWCQVVGEIGGREIKPSDDLKP